MTTPALCQALLACRVESERAAESPPAQASHRTELEQAHWFAYLVLARRDSVVARGPTSPVVLRDGTGAWTIVHDHSS